MALIRMSFVSAVNQPDIVHISSNDDATGSKSAPPAFWTDAHIGFFDSFRVDLETPILDPKGCFVTSAAIPSTGLAIPDYQMAFGFYKAALVGGVGGVPAAGAFTNVANFHYMVGNAASLPGTQAVAPWTTPFKNQPLDNYTDMTAWLNDMVAANAFVLGDATLLDLTFVYDQAQAKIYIETPIAENAFAYQIALPGDPNMIAAVANYKSVILPGAAPDLNGQFSLATRVGFAYSVVSPVLLTGVAVVGGEELWPNSSPNLVFTQTVFLRSSVVQGSSESSNNDHDLLVTVPISAPPLGVTLYQAKTEQPLRRVAKQLFQIDIQMTDDNDQPYYLPDSAIVNTELYFLYK
jgi:hypothetical protein